MVTKRNKEKAYRLIEEGYVRRALECDNDIGVKIADILMDWIEKGIRYEDLEMI